MTQDGIAYFDGISEDSAGGCHGGSWSTGSAEDVEFWELSGGIPVNITSQGALIRTSRAIDCTCQANNREKNWCQHFDCGSSTPDARCFHGFRWTIPQRFLDGTPHYLVAYGVSGGKIAMNYSGPTLEYSDYLIGNGIGDENFVRPLVINPPGSPVGELEEVSCTTIDGWAADPNTPTSPIDVEVWWGDKDAGGIPETTFTAGAADISRSDCQQFYSGDCDVCWGTGNTAPQCLHDFHIPTPADFTAPGSRQVYLYAKNAGGTPGFDVRLPGSGRIISGCLGPWWQVTGGDVTAGSSLSSFVPTSTKFILNGLGGSSGVASYVSSTNLTTTNVSSQGYLAKTEASPSDIYTYKYFSEKIPSDVTVTEVTSNSVTGGFFDSGGTPSRGYVWYHYDGSLGDLSINNVNLVGSRKVVLLVDGANLKLTGTIKITNRGSGFFMVVTGKTSSGTKGNIIVAPSVGGPSGGIEGIYFAEGRIQTSVGTSQLKMRGSFIGYSGFDLQRSISANATTPAETFEFAPELIVLYPSIFTTKAISWKEVNP